MKKYLYGLLALSAVACSTGGERNDDPVEGVWRGTIALNDSTNLPFNFEWKGKDSLYSMTIWNGEEEIQTERIETDGDSLIIRLPVFANYFKIKTITVGYLLPANLTKKLGIGMNRVRFYGMMDNVLTIQSANVPDAELITPQGEYSGGARFWQRI